MAITQKNSLGNAIATGNLPTELIPLENYLEIGNGLPNRKNCFGELFEPVMGIKSVMN